MSSTAERIATLTEDMRRIREGMDNAGSTQKVATLAASWQKLWTERLALQACVEDGETEPTAEQGAALQAYIDAREEVEGLRDDMYFTNVFAEKDEAAAKLGPARAVYAQATREAERLGVLETGRRMFR